MLLSPQNEHNKYSLYTVCALAAIKHEIFLSSYIIMSLLLTAVLVHKVWNVTGNKYKLVQIVEETAENNRCAVACISVLYIADVANTTQASQY